MKEAMTRVAGSPGRRLPRGVVVIALLALMTPAAAASSRSPTIGGPALFQVGTAVESINVPAGVPLYSGGYSYSPPISRQYSPLQVRAFYVSNGQHAVEFAVVDSQAYFAAYQEGPYGITFDRQQAATQIDRVHAGPRMSAGDIIVQGSHSHSAPTLEGIWGPVPRAYLQLVSARTVAALVTAARDARPAYLQWATINAPYILDTAIADDTLPGWSVDGQISVLRAVVPSTGATIGTFVNVPAHPVIIDGAARRILGGDYIAVLRVDIERGLGGTAVVGPSTLGRQEPPVQTTDFTQLSFYAHALYGLVAQALATAHWIDQSTVAAHDSFLRVPVTNLALLALNKSWHLPAVDRAAMGAATGIYPINRADTPPYLTGTVIGTPLTAFRIGRLLYLSMPGEPYPEVRFAISQAVRGTAAVIALSKGQDDLGYFMPAWTYAFGVADQTDHPIYNVAPQMGDQVILAQTHDAAALGFATNPLPASMPAPQNFAQAINPGLQALADTNEGDAGPAGTFAPTLEAIYNPALFDGSPDVGGVRWQFGDGTTATTGYLLTATGEQGHAMFTHAYRPGRYLLHLTARDSAGGQANWTITVRVFPRLVPVIQARHLFGRYWQFTAQRRGGDGALLAAHWAFPGGLGVWGTSVVHAFTGGAPTATLTVTDGTGGTAQASWHTR